VRGFWDINPLNDELNLICHLLALLGAHPILHVSRIRVKLYIFIYIFKINKNVYPKIIRTNTGALTKGSKIIPAFH
jgi:hypothetical protein